MAAQTRAYLYAVAAILCWATAASAFKISLRYVDFLQLLFYSSAASATALFLILTAQKKLQVLRSCSKRDYLISAGLGFLNPFLYYTVLFKSYSLLPAQEAQPLNYTWPIMLVLLSIPLLKQKIGVFSVLGVLISFGGVLVISTRGDLTQFRMTDSTGVSLALSSSVIWALFWIYNLRDRRDVVVRLFLNFLFGLLYASIPLLLHSSVRVSHEFALLGAVYIGLFEMGITFVLWLKALRLSDTTARVSNLVYGAPFLSLIVIRIAVGETILLSTIIGLGLIVTGIVMQQCLARPQLQSSLETD